MFDGDGIDHDERATLDRSDWEALETVSRQKDGLGEVRGVVCNAAPADRIVARRIGQPGTGLAARVVIWGHDDEGNRRSAYVTAAQARKFAAHLLNMADEIDGAAPLVFHPRAVVEDEALDDPTVSSDEVPAEPEDEVEDEVDEDPDLDTDGIALDVPEVPSLRGLLGELVVFIGRKVAGA